MTDVGTKAIWAALKAGCCDKIIQGLRSSEMVTARHLRHRETSLASEKCPDQHANPKGPRAGVKVKLKKHFICVSNEYTLSPQKSPLQ